MGPSNNWYFLIILTDVIERFESCQASYEDLVEQLCTILQLQFYYDYVVGIN
jgi:hypothetical protein